MANGAVLFDNVADRGTMTASAEVAGMEASYLITSPHVWDEMWQANVDSVTLTNDLGTDTSLNTLAFLGLSLSAAATIRVLLSTSALGPAAGDLHDVTYSAADAAFNADLGMFVLPLPAPVSPRYLRAVFTDTGADFIRGGRMVAGTRVTMDYSFAPGSSLGWQDDSAVDDAMGGQSLPWERRRYRVASLDIPWVSNAQRWGMWETIGRVNGRTVDLLVLLDPEAADSIPMWTVWGLVTDMNLIGFGRAGTYSKQLQVKERR